MLWLGAVVIHDFADGSLVGVRAASPAAQPRIESDSTAYLVIDYAAATSDPAARDVMVAARDHDWSSGQALVLLVSASPATRISISFLERNHVADTAWVTLPDTLWRTLRLPFSAWKPNPFFQPPGAQPKSPLDVSDVAGIGVAPQGQGSGRLRIRRIEIGRAHV